MWPRVSKTKLFALWRQFSLQKQKRPFKKSVTHFSFVLKVCRKKSDLK